MVTDPLRSVHTLGGHTRPARPVATLQLRNISKPLLTHTSQLRWLRNKESTIKTKRIREPKRVVVFPLIVGTAPSPAITLDALVKLENKSKGAKVAWANQRASPLRSTTSLDRQQATRQTSVRLRRRLCALMTSPRGDVQSPALAATQSDVKTRGLARPATNCGAIDATYRQARGGNEGSESVRVSRAPIEKESPEQPETSSNVLQL